MSRSSPLPSSTDASPTTTPSDPPAKPKSKPPISLKRKLSIRFAASMRWLHIYLSMFGLATILFFSVTGVTLNHPDWFGEIERKTQEKGQVKLDWIKAGSEDVAKLEVVEHLRNQHQIRGALADFQVNDEECVVTFKGPAYSADAFIKRETGEYEVSQSFLGLIALINDLHKGRDSGKGWSVVIDISAVLMTVVSLTGLVLLFYLKLKRIPGLIVMAVGTIVLFAAYWILAP